MREDVCQLLSQQPTNNTHEQTNKTNKPPKNKVIFSRRTDGRKRDETDDFNFFSFRNPNENITKTFSFTHVLFCVFWKP